MNLDTILNALKKHGALGMTVIALIWMNQRLNFVEKMLYECYEERVESFYKGQNNSRKEVFHLQGLAIIKKEEDEDNRQNKG